MLVRGLLTIGALAALLIAVGVALLVEDFLSAPSGPEASDPEAGTLVAVTVTGLATVAALVTTALSALAHVRRPADRHIARTAVGALLALPLLVGTVLLALVASG